MKIIFSSDFHIGLKTDEFDRTDEIISVVKHVARYAVKSKADILVFGGDIFDCNNPGEDLIAKFIEVLNIVKHKLKVFIMVGNHDSIARSERKSCLSFIGKLKSGYDNIRLIDDVKHFKVPGKLDNVFFTFLPFIEKAHIDEKYHGKPQKYYDRKAKKIISQLPMYGHHFVFSHLSVPGATAGSEQYMLKKVDRVVPESFLFNERTNVINAHIHSRKRIGNVRIVGSPIFVGFGEKEEKKYFLEIDIDEIPFPNGPPVKFTFRRTPCKKFIEWNLGEENLDAEIEARTKILDKKTILKINVEGSEALYSRNWQQMQQQLMQFCHYVKPIRPIIRRTKIKRNKKLRLRSNPKDSVNIWLEHNKPKNREAIRDKAFEYIEHNI